MRSGFTIIRNGDSLGYPYLESITSLAPLVDEIVVAAGDSTDSTTDSLERLATKLTCPLRIVHSPWDHSNIKGGTELSRQTNIALAACRHEICFYLQADELLDDHEFDLIREDLSRFSEDPEVEALAFRWIHFYGSFRHIVESKQWYRREIRAIKKSSGLKSYGDAQGFRITVGEDWKKPKAALSRAHVHHYGWVRPPKVMAQKSEALDRLWHGSARDGTHSEESVYHAQFGLKEYQGTHPTFIKKRVDALGDYNPFVNQRVKKNLKYLRVAATDVIERLSGWRPGEFKNYSSLKKY